MVEYLHNWLCRTKCPSGTDLFTKSIIPILHPTFFWPEYDKNDQIVFSWPKHPLYLIRNQRGGRVWFSQKARSVHSYSMTEFIDGDGTLQAYGNHQWYFDANSTSYTISINVRFYKSWFLIESQVVQNRGYLNCTSVKGLPSESVFWSRIFTLYFLYFHLFSCLKIVSIDHFHVPFWKPLNTFISPYHPLYLTHIIIFSPDILHLILKITAPTSMTLSSLYTTQPASVPANKREEVIFPPKSPIQNSNITGVLYKYPAGVDGFVCVSAEGDKVLYTTTNDDDKSKWRHHDVYIYFVTRKFNLTRVHDVWWRHNRDYGTVRRFRSDRTCRKFFTNSLTMLVPCVIEL